MATLQVIAVRDFATNTYSRPMFLAAIGQAIRMFGDEINREAQDNVMNHHPEDYELWHLGEWDEGSGKFTELDTPNRLVRGSEVKENYQAPKRKK